MKIPFKPSLNSLHLTASPLKWIRLLKKLDQHKDVTLMVNQANPSTITTEVESTSIRFLDSDGWKSRMPYQGRDLGEWPLNCRFRWKLFRFAASSEVGEVNSELLVVSIFQCTQHDGG